MLLYDLGDNENNELIDDLEEYRDDDNELIDDLEGYRDDDNELIDDREGDEELDENVESENEYEEVYEEVFEENNLFITPELEEENENYEGIELEDKIDIEILIWLFKFQQRYRLSDNALEALIKFLNVMLKSIDDFKFWEFPASLYLAKKKLGIFQPKLRMAVCTNCHKLYDSKIVCNYKENNKLAIMNCCYEEYPNNPVSSRKKLCNNELSSLKKNMKNMVAILRMLYPKSSIK